MPLLPVSGTFPAITDPAFHLPPRHFPVQMPLRLVNPMLIIKTESANPRYPDAGAIDRHLPPGL
jgi:hypothetical protein